MTVSQDKAKEQIKTVLTSGSDWQIERALSEQPVSRDLIFEVSLVGPVRR